MAINAAKLAIQIQAEGDDSVIDRILRIGESGEQLGHKYSRASLRIAETAAQFVEMGNVGGSALTRLIGLGGELALGFGIGGPIVGAIGVAAYTLYNFFKKSRDEAQKTTEEFQKQANTLLDLGNYTEIEKQLRDVYLGTPSKAYADGLKALREERAKLVEELQNPDNYGKSAQQNLAFTQAIQKQLDDLDAKIKPVQERYDYLRKLITTPDTRAGTGLLQGVTVTAGAAATALEDAQKAEAKEVDTLSALAQLRLLSVADFTRLQDLERKLTAEIEKGNVANARKLQIAQELEKIRKSALVTPTLAPEGFLDSLSARNNAPTVPFIRAPGTTHLSEDEKDAIRQQMQEAAQVSAEGGQLVGSAITDGISRALSGGGLAGGFKVLIGELLSGLGSMFLRMGPPIQLFGKIMEALRKAVHGNPLLAGAVAIAAGAALIALGHSLSGAAGGGGGAGGGGSAYSASASAAEQVTNITITSGQAVATAAKIFPTQPVTFHVFGPNDPAAQNAIADAWTRAQRRGLV